MKLRPFTILLFLSVIFCFSCRNEQKESDATTALPTYKIKEKPEDIPTPNGMVWVPGGIFQQGALPTDRQAMEHEKPAHPVLVEGFFMDETEVTNAGFKNFVDESGYVTVAERQIIWEEFQKQLPPGTPKPHDSLMQPGSLVFNKPLHNIDNLQDFSQWWKWKVGASWKHPQGPESSIEGKENHPVVHIAYEDAVAYCEWANRRLPTEAEWEFAARAERDAALFAWGRDSVILNKMANTWTGDFPVNNSAEDGHEGSSPVASFPANPYGLYDMAGNVWEFTDDFYDPHYYRKLLNMGVAKNPTGPEISNNSQYSAMVAKVIKGGSYLCHASYCASYRISARMPQSLDSSHEHLGFRTVASADMLRK